MRRAWLLLLLCGCASTNKTDAVTAQAPTIFQDQSGTLTGETPRSAMMDIAAPPATVWLAVKKVYADMDIPVTLENPAAHQIGNRDFFKSRQLGGQSMVNLVDCGSGMTGPNAASYRIYISLITVVEPDSKGGTNLQTMFVTSGQDMSGVSSDRIPCASTGRFEGLFQKKVAATLGK